MRLFFVIPYLKDSDETWRKAVCSVQKQGPGLCRGGSFDFNLKPDDLENRKYSLHNIYDGIIELHGTYGLKDDDIIAILDGDDELFDENVAYKVIDTYKRYHCVLTYGSYIEKSRSKDFLNRVKGSSITLRRGKYRNGENVRHSPFKASHLKTFTYGLFKYLPLSELKDKDGNWLKVAGDVALMLPLMELAGYDRIRHISEPLVIYNDESPLNDHKVSGSEQKETELWIRSKKPFQRLIKI